MKQNLLHFCPFITHPANADRGSPAPPGSGSPTLYEQVEQQQWGIFTSHKNENTEELWAYHYQESEQMKPILHGFWNKRLVGIKPIFKIWKLTEGVCFFFD